MKEKVIGGRYIYKRTLGRGGSGSVFLCQDMKLQKEWAVKEICMEAEAMLLQEQMSELNLLKTISCNLFPRIVDVVYEWNRAYLVMDYVEGMTLAERMKRQRLTEEEMLPWALEIAKALLYLHQMTPQILYMDCKPENIMLTSQGEIRMVDLGSVYICQEGKKQKISGTRFFASKEQQGDGNEEQRPDVRSDIYAFGMTMYYLLAGKKKIYRRMGRLSVKDANPTVSEGMNAIIARCTQTDIEKRPQSMDEVLYLLTHMKQLNRQAKRKGRLLKVALLVGKSVCACMILAGTWLYTKEQKTFEFIGSMVAGIVFIILCMKRRFAIYEVKKEVFCGSGKRVLLYFLIMCGVLRIMSLPVFAETGRKDGETKVPQKAIMEGEAKTLTEKEQELEVTIYDKRGRKLLLQDDAVWQVSEDILLAIPLEVIEETEGIITVSYEIENGGMVKKYQISCCRK